MSVATSPSRSAAAAACRRHPNELDVARIARAIGARTRYRYVSPAVLPVEDGYLIRSACCSRSIQPDGGEIDVALLRWHEAARVWSLHRKDHRAECWIEDSRFARLPELVARLNADPARQFWQ